MVYKYFEKNLAVVKKDSMILKLMNSIIVYSKMPLKHLQQGIPTLIEL